MDTYSLLYVIRGAKPFAPDIPANFTPINTPTTLHFGLAFQSHATLILNHNAKPFCSMTYSEIITVSYEDFEEMQGAITDPIIKSFTG